MAVRELVENSLDATELAGILPDVYVRIVANDPSVENANQEPKAYRVTVADNGPGVDPHHVPRAFGKVFYGSKYVLRQSRGMFGMGGTMAILYGQITTNKPVKITTSTDGKSRHIFEMLIDISENKPIILRKDTEDGAGQDGDAGRRHPRGRLHPRGAEDQRILQADRARRAATPTSPSSTRSAGSRPTRGRPSRCRRRRRRRSRTRTASTSRRSSG